MFFAIAASQATGLPAWGIFAGTVAASLVIKKEQHAFFTAIDTTELVSVLGDYYRENRDLMFSKMLLDPSVTSMFAVYDDVTDELPLPKLEIANIIKPGTNKAFQPTADALGFGARILKVRDIKFDIQILPTELHKKWLGYRRSQRRADGSHDMYEIPFEEFIMDYIIKSARNQLYLQAMYKGDYNSAGTTPATTMTGFATLVTDLIAAEVSSAGTGIVPVLGDDITSSNVITRLEAVYDSLGEPYKAVPTEMKVSPTIFDWYNRKYRTDFGANNNYAGMDRTRVQLDGTLCDVVREPGLAGSGRVMCSVRENFAYGCDTMSTATMEIQKDHRNIDIMGDFKAGVQFVHIDSDVLAVNELASDSLA